MRRRSSQPTPSPQRLHVAIDEDGVVYLFGELAQSTVTIFEQAVSADGVVRPLRIDLQQAIVADLAGLVALSAVNAAERAHGRTTTLLNASSDLRARLATAAPGMFEPDPAAIVRRREDTPGSGELDARHG